MKLIGKQGREGEGGPKEKKTRRDWIAKFAMLSGSEVRHDVLTMFNAVCVIIYAIRATRLKVGEKG